MLLTLFEKKQEAKDVMSFKFKGDEPLNWKPGQYLFYTLPNDDPDNRGVTRYFTISSAPFEKFIMVTTRISKPRLPAVKAGKPSSSFKKSLTEMKIGNRITASGPDGDFTIRDPKKNYVFIAGGIGITPFRSILLDLDHKKLPINAQLLYANRDKDIVFKSEVKSLIPQNPNFKINYFISPQRIDASTIEQLNNINNRMFYVSGPESFVDAYSQILKNIGIPNQNIKLDHFPGYES